ncbi:MAG: HD-GYP domain-containing protein [Dissulfurispiraceae bacterium]|jgi:HD-GYP domain-containing protein (c-di-GMP phosphodiesterase class II)
MGTKYRVIAGGYISFPVNKLVTGSRLLFDIYVNDGGTMRQLFNKGSIITDAALLTIRTRGFTEIYAVHDSGETPPIISAASKEESALDNPTVFKKYSFQKDGHHLIDRSLLIPGTQVPFSIYVLNRLRFETVVEASESSPATIDENVPGEAGDFMISSASIPLYREYLRSLEKSSSIAPAKISKMKSIALKENSKIIVKQLFDSNRIGAGIKEAKSVVDGLVNLILENSDAMYDLMSIKDFDYYTYSHSVNVGVLSIGLGISIGMKKDSIFKLGLGAILHDIGKRAIHRDIVNKQGRLNDMEYQVIKTHVVEGEKILRESSAIPQESLAAMLYHHEKLTGRGYPFGLKEKNIDVFGKITAIVDSYDALTTARPYRAALAPFEALSLITGEKGDYDPELLKIFITMLRNIRL